MTIAKARPLEHVLDPLKSGLDVEPAYQIDRDPSLRLSLPVPGEEGRRMTGRARCSSCGSEDLDFFHHAEGVPVNSCIPVETREAALAFPRGNISLAFCRGCGFIFNAAFDESLIEYSERYEPTQAFSGTFNRWHLRIAQDLLERYALREKRIIEIGCGKGEFLTMLCELGANVGIGFDPALDPARMRPPKAGEARFVQDLYSENYAHVKADLVCCKMTLEHVARAADFVGMVRRAVGDDPKTGVFFQVPDVRRILEEHAFWDIYYEHCNYFSAGSLARLFRRAGFSVEAVRREYDDQYLMIDCRPANGRAGTASVAEEDDIGELRQLVDRFSSRLPIAVRDWRERIRGFRRAGKRVVIWGAGSKGVAFLTTLGLGVDDVEFAVDVNPHRHGQFVPTTGQEIIGPEQLLRHPPDVVVVMNPVYKREIEADLRELGLQPEVLTT
jgi:SAM-dependent methyltransferase